MDLSQCLSILTKASSDNEKMAAMLVVSFTKPKCPVAVLNFADSLQAAKLIKSGDIGSEDRKKIFNAIGFNFLNRLLATSELYLIK